ncbi:hypothetical protein PC9H_006392 [Pleurotus ostreatus]|uniref:RING-type E3 ubiquitin transferase n=1 Tax=Pleurotus ostreatus TaxID=5322 RepID=A0A8H7DSZ3_PLEOS|nr:uncharacterized protein PC9H_006392 [Pleurotus ostreatus]KAF7430683.1 hypothetical protein PC9H_006392 [Pleurotus ostreatus]
MPADDTPRNDDNGTVNGRERQRGSVPSFLFISFVLFMLTNHSGDEFLARHQYQDALRSLSYQLSNFTAWRNGTESDFSLPDVDVTAQPLVDFFLHHGHLQDPNRASYHPNITGFLRGEGSAYNITLLSLAGETVPWKPLAVEYTSELNITEASERAGSWNWTASEKVALSLVEKPTVDPQTGQRLSDDVALAHGRIEFTDINTSDELRLEFEAIHFITNGSFYGFALPNGRQIDIRLLPSLVPEPHKNATADMIKPEIEARIKKLQQLIDDGNIVVDPDAPNPDEGIKTNCSFTFQAHLVPSKVPQYLMTELEEEIQKPTGASTVEPPRIAVDALFLSKDCGILYEIHEAEGLRSRTFFRKVTTYAATAGIVYLILLFLLIRQMEISRTPSGIARVSRWTLLFQATMDSLSFAGHITFAILFDGRASLSLVAPAFLACTLFIHEAQFAILVYQVQLPEDSVPTVQPTPNVNPSAVINPPTEAAPTAIVPTPPVVGPQPQPATATNTAATETPGLLLFWRFITSDPQIKVWFALFLFVIVLVRVILSPVMGVLYVAFSYSSIWMPQIIRSARRGRGSGLSKEYLLGTSACRVYLMLYFLVCPKNVLEVQPRQWTWLLAMFVFAQVGVVLLQDRFGPDFFLPARFKQVNVYDYHPVLPLPDAEAPEQSLGDCAICMDAILIDSSLRRRSEDKLERQMSSSKSNVKARTSGFFSAMQKRMVGGGATARKSYSLAPCHHLFHTECLEKWLAIKNICPQCRRPLPPL